MQKQNDKLAAIMYKGHLKGFLTKRLAPILSVLKILISQVNVREGNKMKI